MSKFYKYIEKKESMNEAKKNPKLDKVAKKITDDIFNMIDKVDFEEQGYILNKVIETLTMIKNTK